MPTEMREMCMGDAGMYHELEHLSTSVSKDSQHGSVDDL